MENTILLQGKLNFLMDGNNGSSGKGKISSFLVKNQEVDYLVTSNSANASHTVVEDGKEFVFKVLPSGSIHHKKLKKVFVTAGSSFELQALLEEIEMLGIPREKIGISPRAGVIQQIDKDFENGLCDLDGNYFEVAGDGTMKTGTTASGSGSVLAKKTVRNKTLVVAKDIEEIADMICDVPEEILKLHGFGCTGFFEIGQGFPLSNNHKFAPNTTSRNVTVSSALNDAFLPPYLVGNVILNFRTYPIRIHSKRYQATEDWKNTHKYTLVEEKDSILKELKKTHTMQRILVDEQNSIINHEIKAGDYLSWEERKLVPHEEIDSYSGDFYGDQQEISWEELNKRLGNKGKEIFECTTLTKLPRRIAEFSKENLLDAIKYNHTGNKCFISVNFANYVSNDITDKKDLESLEEDEKLMSWINENIYPVLREYQETTGLDCWFSLLGTGAETDSTIYIPSM